MLLKIFRVVWFLSVMILFVVLLYGYAGWQENMIIQDNPGERLTMSREMLFYAMLLLVVLVNLLVYLVAKMYRSAEHFRSWFHGLVIVVNIFFIIAINL